MSVFDIENVEWPADVPTGPTRTSVQWVHGEPGDKGRGATSIGGLEVVPADAYRKAVEEIARLESECREWKEQCEKGDAKLVRECEEWREQCRKSDDRTKPYRCADCDQPHGPFNQVGSGRSDNPEITYRLVCDRCLGPTHHRATTSPIEKAADELAEAVRGEIFDRGEAGGFGYGWNFDPPDSDAIGAALSNYLKVKESHERG